MTLNSEYKKVVADPEYFRKKYYEELHPEPTAPIEVRKSEFQRLVALYATDFSEPVSFGDQAKFIEYWTQTGKRGNKMRFEKENIFHFTGRLSTWMRNKKRFGAIKLTQKIFNGRTQSFPH